jgi:hypothetical protein
MLTDLCLTTPTIHWYLHITPATSTSLSLATTPHAHPINAEGLQLWVLLQKLLRRVRRRRPPKPLHHPPVVFDNVFNVLLCRVALLLAQPYAVHDYAAEDREMCPLDEEKARRWVKKFEA